SVKGLKKVYKVGDQKVVALNNIDLDIEKGEICCLLGTSGSGKSTLLNMLAGLEKPTKGSINIGEYSVERLSEKQLANFRQCNVGFVFQSYNLLPTMNAIDNVSMPLLFAGVSKKERNEKAKNILKEVGLGERMNHKPTEMSGGQQQRVGIARAFVALPKIVFADEPTGNLDSKTTLEVMSIMINLAKENNQTLIIVTHDPSIANYADKIVRILDGNIQSVEINQNPTKPIVRQEK
ncbi:MAG: ABC transporter ATP-binding protein, partial [Oscillospiraceae bacterium]